MKKINSNQIFKKTAIANILIAIFLIFCIYFSHKESNFLMEFVCIAVIPFVIWNCYKYFFKAEFRKDLNEYHLKQKALPRKERDRYNASSARVVMILFSIFSFFIIVLIGIILKFFNLL